MNMTRINYAVCTTWVGKYLWSLIATVFQNDRLFKVRRPTGSHVHRKSGSIKEMARDINHY